MGDEKKGGKIPEILEERLLINDSDRELLVAMNELSPKDNGIIYVTPSIFNRQVPTLKQISDKVGGNKLTIWKQLNKIRKIWNIPNAKNLPTNSGFFDREDALVNALTNQHRLRFDENFGDYRVPKIHLMSAEMGCGTLYTNNEAFIGENIFRKAIGLDEKLNSVHFQGGIMPEMIQIFGKAKNQRALMTGLNKTGTESNEEKLKKIQQTLTLAEYDLTPRDMTNLQNFVIDTLGSQEEAAKSVAHEMLPLVENIPEHVPIHFYYSYNDIANMSEIEDTLNQSLKKIHSTMRSATKNLPGWREKRGELKEDIGQNLIDKLILERVYHYVNTEQRSKYEEDKFPEQGKEFGNLVNSFFKTKEGKDKVRYKNLKKKVQSDYQSITNREIKTKADEEQFNSEFYDIVNKIYEDLTTFEKLKKSHKNQQERFGKSHKEMSSLEYKIHESERFENALMVEDAGPSWFTGHIAINPMESKTLQMVKKYDYKKNYTEILIPTLQELAGKKLDIKLHTDSIITVNVPDPQDLIEGKESTNDSPIGTLFTSFPRTNEQRSNEPLKNSAAELQAFHEGEVSERIKKGKSKPRTIGEFNKRDFSSADIFFTSYGADGFMHQPRFTVGPTTIKGEFRLNPEITQYFKLTTRHDTSKLGDLMVKGNKGTWPARRLVKGGCTTGNTIYIEHADQSFQPIFVDDVHYQIIAKKYGEEYSKLEETLKQTQDKEVLNQTKKRIEEIHKEVRPVLNNVLLQNDLHLGAYSTSGRPALVDGIKSSQLAAIQTVGLNNIQYSIMTEVFNGEQAWRSYDSKREGSEGSQKSDVQFMKELNFIKSKMLKKGFSDKDIIEYSEAYTKEFLESKPSFLPEEQSKLFQDVCQPVCEELMDNGMQLYAGSGNHWMSKKENISEADVICNLFDRKYQEQGILIKTKPTSGQSYSYETVLLPDKSGEGIPAVITHKLPSGKTEISQIASHLVRNRSPAKYCFTADRHHPGIVAEKGKMAIMDVGKQPTIPYVDMIGKVSSVRGTMIGNYGANNELIISARYFVDPVVDKISGWDHTAGVLKMAKSLLEEAVKDNSLYTEMRRINNSQKRNKEKFYSIEKKYSK